jgi:Transglycosylase SLT domain
MLPSLAVLLSTVAFAAPTPPSPERPVPRDPQRLTFAMEQTAAELSAAVARWREDGGTGSNPPPEDVQLWALWQQRTYLFLGDRPRLAAKVLPKLRDELRAEAEQILAARRALGRLNPPTKRKPGSFSTGAAKPAAVLRGYYREAQRRFKVSWRVLASVNLVETTFNKIRSNSTAGAQGPMQFIPSTWSAYGMGGNIRDPHDAILGAANYLRASGAPGDYRRALYAYNPSQLYVTAVRSYAKAMRSRPEFFYELYNWQVFVRTPSGRTRISGPGL